MPDGSPEVLVLGGGPAGFAAASLLSRWGHRVVLKTTATAHGGLLAESVPPSTRKLLDVVGLTAAMDDGGFVRSSGNTVWWGGGGARVEAFAAGERGWQVSKARLEEVLWRQVVKTPVAAERARVEAASLDAGRYAFTLDCTGRAGVLAKRRRLRRTDSSRRTIALTGTWCADAATALADPTHTLIESYEGGWAWSVPLSATDRVVAVMVDPGTSGLTRNAPARDVYLQEIGRTSQMAALARGARLTSGPVGWDASMYDAKQYVDGDVLLVGDAASFVDPISSAGVKKALASGWLAAVAVHTSLRRPAMRNTALGFFAAREAEVFASLRGMTARMLAAAATGHGHPFWSDRTEVSAADDGGDEAADAFARLRAESVLRLQRNAAVRIEECPAVSGVEIVLEPRLVSPARPDGVRYAFGVDLLALVNLAPSFSSVPDLFATYNQHHAAVDLPDFLAALSTAIAQDWLVWV